MDLNFLLAILTWFGANATIAVIVPLIVDILKRFGVVKDGDAGKWSAGLNLLGLVGFSAYFLLSKSVDFGAMDATLKVILQIVQVVLAYAMQLFISPAVHNRALDSNLPLLGYSLSEVAWQDEED